MSNIFFTSDLHFGHKNLLKFTNPRPFKTIEEHDEALINNWNSVVKQNDKVYVLGDVALNFDSDELESKLIRLNGDKYLILGNHDRAKNHAKYLNLGIWQEMHERSVIRVMADDGKLYHIVLDHYPELEFYHAFDDNCFHLYGHIHNLNNYDEIYKKLGFKAAHVGIDTSDKYPNTKPFTPIKLENLLTWFEENFKK